MLLSDWVDAELELARKRVWRVILRTIHHASRSAGQRRRREREKVEVLTQLAA